MNQHVTIKPGNRHSMTSRIGAVVDFVGVSKAYGRALVLHPTSLQIAAGEFFAIIGPSGSGKSTLLGITAGFVPLSQGTIKVDGTEVVSVPPYRRSLGMVFQHYALFPHMTVADNVAFPLRMRGYAKPEIKARVDRMLDMVRLKPLADRRPSQLSGGQQQRVALARAAVYDPQLLLMDEPLGALDKNLREEMQEEIKRFQAALGATVIYVTHDQHEAAYMADRVAIMRAGRIVQAASPRELYENPASTFVASFLGEASLLPVGRLISVEGGIAQFETGGGLTLHATAADGVRAGSVCIRPENIVMGASARELENSFQGRIADVVFTTGSVRYRVQLDREGGALTVRVPSHPGIALMPPGSPVEVGWRSQDARLVEDDGA